MGGQETWQRPFVPGGLCCGDLFHRCHGARRASATTEEGGSMAAVLEMPVKATKRARFSLSSASFVDHWSTEVLCCTLLHRLAFGVYLQTCAIIPLTACSPARTGKPIVVAADSCPCHCAARSNRPKAQRPELSQVLLEAKQRKTRLAVNSIFHHDSTGSAGNFMLCGEAQTALRFRRACCSRCRSCEVTLRGRMLALTLLISDLCTSR